MEPLPLTAPRRGRSPVRNPILFWVLCALGLAPSSLPALSPMYGPHDLVAGSGDAGSKDGPFYSARFFGPEGLALDPTTRTLYVSDTGNNALRSIDLKDQNKVSTLAGGTTAGFQDGPASSALFDHPSAMTFVPGKGLIVADNGNARIRLWDPVSTAFTTLIGDGQWGTEDGTGPQARVQGVGGMVFLPGEDALLFSQPGKGVLRVLDLRTLRVRTLPAQDASLPHPCALCRTGQGIYVADQDNGDIFRLTLGDQGRSRLDRFHTGPKVLSLFTWEEKVYAVQSDPQSPLLQVLPKERPVHALSVWGDGITDPTDPCGPWQKDRIPFSVVPDPASPGKFYAALPERNLISSFRDLQYEETRKEEDTNSQGLMDFEYPLVKPPSTFRILLVGDSHVYHDYGPVKDLDNRMDLVGKKLELELNTLSVLTDNPVHFEVLTLAENSWNPLNLWPYHEAPPVVEKYGVDLVLVLLTKKFDLGWFFQAPPDSEGIPADKIDTEYVLKPWSERVPAGAAKVFYALCQKKGWVDKKGEITFDYPKMAQDPSARDLMAQIYSLPLRRLGEKLHKMRSSGGKPVQLAVVMTPHLFFRPDEDLEDLWTRVLSETHMPFADLTPAVTALRPTLFPLSEAENEGHFDPNGHRTIASLLFFEIWKDQWAPLGDLPAPKGRQEAGPLPEK